MDCLIYFTPDYKIFKDLHRHKISQFKRMITSIHLPRRVACVSESHIAHSELVVAAENAERVADRVATFNADERRNLAGSGAVSF